MSEVYGHEKVRAELAAAVRRDQLPGSLLIHGLPGTGRQTLARWLARYLVCRQPGAHEPCNACPDCHLALDLQHPDIHWFFPLPRPKGASSPERLAEAIESARFEALAERRLDPFHQPPDDEPCGLYLAQVRTIRKLGSTRPAMAARQVFIIGDAELLVPQEASDEAANAMLKILEEPPPATTFILTAAEPAALLPTLRSRLLPVRVPPFTDAQVATFLTERLDTEPGLARTLARLGRGSIGRALAFLPRDGDPSSADLARIQALDWLEAALDPSPAPRYAAALLQKPVGARGTFGHVLDAMSLHLRDLAALAANADQDILDLRARGRLEELVAGIRHERIPEAIDRVEEAREGGRVNANPQLTLAWLLDRIATELRP
jgi:DNA polymerase III subunit delta'